MKSTKKGQGALEYLMTYGWALLIIVVVGAALYALGVLNPATYTKATCAGFNYFNYQDHQLQQDGTFTLVANNGNQDAWIYLVTVGSDSNTSAMTGDDTPSATQEFTLTATQFETNNADKSTGDAYTYEVTIRYNTEDITEKLDKATCTGNVE